MKTIIAFLAVGGVALAGDLFDQSGTPTMDATNGRSLVDWCLLATNAKSAKAQVTYAETIARSVATLDRDEIVPTELQKTGLRKAGLALLKASDLPAAGPQENWPAMSRQRALQFMRLAVDESCLPALLNEATGESLGEVRSATRLIGAIGGKKATAALVKLAKSPLPDPRSNNHDPLAAERVFAAVGALGAIDGPEGEAALKGLRRYATTVHGWSLTPAVDKALSDITERRAAAEDAKSFVKAGR
jgi:hypothetical protein